MTIGGSFKVDRPEKIKLLDNCLGTQVKMVNNKLFDCSIGDFTGTKTVYSDLGIILLGGIIEKITGKTLDKLADELIFQPLKQVK